MFTYLVYLIFVYPSREPTFAKNSTTEMLAPVRDRPMLAQPARSPSACCMACRAVAGASMVPFRRCDLRVARCDRKLAELGVTLDCACRDRVQGRQVSCVASHRKGDDVHPLHRSVDQLPVHHFRHHEGRRCDRSLEQRHWNYLADPDHLLRHLARHDLPADSDPAGANRAKLRDIVQGTAAHCINQPGAPLTRPSIPVHSHHRR